MEILIGADPEVFVQQQGKFVSAHNLVPGTKKEPHKVKSGAVQVDGMALEFNINPAKTARLFRSNIKTVMAELRKMVPAKFEIMPVATAHFDEAYMATVPDDAKVLGCDPDFDAYTGRANPRPDQHPTMRTAAGHVHIGWCQDVDPGDPGHFEGCRQLVHQLDWFLGYPAMLVDKDVERRQMYGKAGAFRPKPYGCEYRVLSNFWLNDAALIDWVYNNTQAAVANLMAGRHIFKSYGSATVRINSTRPIIPSRVSDTIQHLNRIVYLDPPIALPPGGPYAN